MKAAALIQELRVAHFLWKVCLTGIVDVKLFKMLREKEEPSGWLRGEDLSFGKVQHAVSGGTGISLAVTAIFFSKKRKKEKGWNREQCSRANSTSSFGNVWKGRVKQDILFRSWMASHSFNFHWNFRFLCWKLLMFLLHEQTRRHDSLNKILFSVFSVSSSACCVRHRRLQNVPVLCCRQWNKMDFHSNGWPIFPRLMLGAHACWLQRHPVANSSRHVWHIVECTSWCQWKWGWWKRQWWKKTPRLPLWSFPWSGSSPVLEITGSTQTHNRPICGKSFPLSFLLSDWILALSLTWRWS